MKRPDDAVQVRRWAGEGPPDEAEIRRRLAQEGLRAACWSNGPGDVHGTHTHAYDKVIYVVRRAIAFGLPNASGEVLLRAGDRLDLPAGVAHNAVVGQEGVLCLEAHR